MINVLMDPLPEEWQGYRINTWFQIGLQISNLYYDRSISDLEKSYLITCLLFEDEDGELRDHPKDIWPCVSWFLNGWNHDNGTDHSKTRLVDFDKDQWRIYADFLSIYRIDLTEADLHWWQFNGLLWNMPAETSSFMKVISIRDKKIVKGMSTEEVKCIREAQKVYALEQAEKKFSKEEENKIDEIDKLLKRG